MTTAVAIGSVQRQATQFLATRAAKIAIAVIVAASLMLNGYYYAVTSTINSDLVDAGIIQTAPSGGAIGFLEMSVLQENVKSVAVSAGQAAAAVEQLQAALAQAQAAAAQ